MRRSNGYRAAGVGVPPEVAGLLRPDGSVIVPASVAGEVLRALVRDLTARVRADGGEVSPGVRRLLWALHDAAQRHDEAASPSAVTPGAACGSGSESPGSGTVEVTTAEAAERLECSASWVRQLVRRGLLTGRRVGARVWLVDVASLENYRRGRTA